MELAPALFSCHSGPRICQPLVLRFLLEQSAPTRVALVVRRAPSGPFRLPRLALVTQTVSPKLLPDPFDRTNAHIRIIKPLISQC